MFPLALIVGVAGVIAGGVLWVESTHTADPLSASPGIGFEGAGDLQVPVGAHVVFSGYLLGDAPISHATITGVTLPHLPGLRVGVYAVARQLHGVVHGYPTVGLYEQGRSFSRLRLAPIAGRSLRAPPAGFDRRNRPVLTVALVAIPLRSGCYSITGVRLHYRVGDTTFTKQMNGEDVVSTTRQDC